MLPHQALELAAQCWCTPNTEDITMNERLAKAFADCLLREVNKAVNEAVAAAQIPF